MTCSPKVKEEFERSLSHTKTGLRYTEPPPSVSDSRGHSHY